MLQISNCPEEVEYTGTGWLILLYMNAETGGNYLKDELYNFIKEDNRIFEFIQNSLLDGIWYWDLENTSNEWVNPRFWEVLGYDPAQIRDPYQIWKDIIVKEDLEELLKIVQHLLKKPETIFDQVIRFLHKNGSIVWIRCRGLIIKDEYGKPFRMLGGYCDISNLKNSEQQFLDAQKEIKRSSLFYQSVIETSVDGFWLVDMKGNILEVNEVYCQMSGYSKEEIVGKNASFFDVTEEPTDTLARIDEILKIGSSRFESCHHDKNNNLFDVEVSLQVLNVEDGFLITFIRDITEKKKAEKALIKTKKILEENEEKFRLIAENTSDGILVSNAEGKITYVSPSYAMQLGYNENEIIGRSPQKIFSLLHPDERDEVFKLIYDAIDQKRTELTYTFRVKHKQGHYIWREDHAKFNYSPDGTHISNYVICRDVTDRKNAEINLIEKNKELLRAKEKAEKSESEYVNLIQTLNDGFLRVDTDGNIVMANVPVAGLFGYSSPQEMIGLPMQELYANSGDRSLMLKDLSINKVLKNYEIRLKRKDGSEFWSLNNIILKLGKDGASVGIEGLIRDITDIKNAEKEKLQKEKLEREIALAEESLLFKQRFLANMSHEIRTPLTGILGMAEILRQSDLKEEQLDYLNTLIHSGNNLREIINDVLDFSKIEAGQTKLKMRVFPPESLVRNAESLFKSICKKDILFEWKYDSKLPEYIIADEIRLTQVVSNLVSNAVKFTVRGQIKISMELMYDNISSEELMIKVTVSDTGKGIPERMKNKLFKPFSQIEEEDTREFEGTGLGLSISKELVKLHGGEIGVESQPDKGSMFWFTFRSRISDAEAIEDGEKIKKSITKDKHLTVLLAEDKLVNQKVIRLLLNAMGHSVEIVENGQKAIDLFEPNKFDIILMDIQMPVMDGITATQILRKSYALLPPIIGLSANAFEGDREKYMARGMDEYLTKPVNMIEFKRVLEKFF